MHGMIGYYQITTKEDAPMPIPETLTLMEIFFAAYCNQDGDTTIPICMGCPHNIYRRGCTHPENPIIKEGK